MKELIVDQRGNKLPDIWQNMGRLMERKQYAKDAVIWLLDHPDGNVDFHGLTYWAGEVERLRIEIKKLL